MNHRQRFIDVMNFKKPDNRLPMFEWAKWWNKTLERWYLEGLDRNIDFFDIAPNLGLDCFRQFWFLPYLPEMPKPKEHGHPIIQSREDYLNLKDYLYPQTGIEDYFKGLESIKEAHERGDVVVWITLDGYFWFPRKLFGIENHLFAFYDNPELMHEINRDLTDYHLWLLDRISNILKPDFMTFAEDMSYNLGPMLSKECFSEFLLPYYKRLIPKIKENNIIPFIDSDGNPEQMIPWLIEAGIEGILPLERQAGTDINGLRKKYPEFKFIGAFDKMVMKNGESAMREEFDRLLPVMVQGGFIPSVDHQTPPDVSLENYKIYVRLLREYCQKALTP